MQQEKKRHKICVCEDNIYKGKGEKCHMCNSGLPCIHYL